MIKSPCKSICKLDLNEDLCLGCGRTKDEITNWIHYNAKERERIMKKIEKRDDKYLKFK